MIFAFLKLLHVSPYKHTFTYLQTIHMHLYYTDCMNVCIDCTDTHVPPRQGLRGHQPYRVFFEMNRLIVLFKSFLQWVIAVVFCQNHKITSMTSTLIQFHNMEKQVKSRLENVIAELTAEECLQRQHIDPNLSVCLLNPKSLTNFKVLI